MPQAHKPANDKEKRSALKVFLVFLRLGLTSFGGPIAHLGYFREEFVVRRKWLSEQSYADLVSLCQFLPGPASSQVGIALGLSRAGYKGALAAWIGFTLPSAIAMILFALGLANANMLVAQGALQGLKIVAVAVVAQAVWGMARNFCPDGPRVTIMIIAACFVLLLPSAWSQIGVMFIAGLIGLLLRNPEHAKAHGPVAFSIKPGTGLAWLALFVALLLGLPLLTALMPNSTLVLIDAFFRAGSLVFGGGHVVLPVLQAEVVPPGWISNDTFLAGYGAAQALPGPLFTFAGFLGASISGASGGIICLLAIFAPSFLLVAGVLPFWQKLRGNDHIRAALAGVNAAVVGLLLAALYQPVWVNAIFKPADVALALLALVALMFWKLPPWLVVISGGLAGWLLH